jgi:putative colanic acid biosynthesis UDP-glucose lipid carrier transferase
MFDRLPATDEIHGPIVAAAAPAWAPLFRRGRSSAACKRAFDLTVAAFALVLLLPALLAIALAIVIETPGPALFRQRRTGRDGRVFTIVKFRTMTVTEDGAVIRHATRNDQRVTPLGDVLRRTGLDELPQLLNVIAGDMSLVGPRPHALAHDLHYGALLPRYGDRFAVRPGMTGLAQVQGLRGEIRSLGCMRDRIEADGCYARRWSFRDDLVILLRTVPLVFGRVSG